MKTDEEWVVQTAFPGPGGHLDQIDGGAGLAFRINGDVTIRVDAEVSAAPAMDAVQTDCILDFPLFRRFRHRRILTRKRKEKATIVVIF